jgi:hypothetical protein
MIPIDRGDLIAKLIIDNNYKVIAEVGVSKGDTVRKILTNLDKNKYYLDKFYLIDLPESVKEERYLFEIHHLRKHIESKLFTFLFVGSSQASFSVDDNYLDLVFVDGDHSEDGFYRDLRIWWRKVKKGGILIGDELVDNNYSYREKIVKKFFKGHEINTCIDTRLSSGKQARFFWVYKT